VSAGEHPPVTRDASWIRELGQRFSNWGRFGENDERGTLNFITRERVRSACALPRTGQVISCALPFDSRGPQNGALGRFNPEHAMLSTGAKEMPGGLHYTDDVVRMPLQCGTQWDSLAHVFYDGKLYNGRDASCISESGASANSIDRLAASVVGRGVLLDLPRARGLRWLDDSTAILPEDLDGCAERQGVTIESGDIVLVRTGRLGRALEAGAWDNYLGSPTPGLSIRCARWLYEREIAAVATDTSCVEVLPSEIPGCMLPLHMVAIRDMGLLLGEIFALDALAAACAADGNYEFLFSAPPLPITGAVGSPINPVAIR
jgi:kynurenine formamidase